MRKRILISLIIMLMIAITISCQSSENSTKHKLKYESTIWINSKKAVCNAGGINKECYMIKRNLKQKEWELFSDEIIGFQYEEGYEYEIKVETKKMKTPLADASSVKYTLMKVIRKKEIQNGLSIANQWIISSFAEQENLTIPVSKDSFIMIDEKENKFNGNGACNTISGDVLISGNAIRFEKIISTEMACENLEQENKFIKALEAVTTFKIIGCELFLYRKNEKLVTLESCR